MVSLQGRQLLKIYQQVWQGERAWQEKESFGLAISSVVPQESLQAIDVRADERRGGHLITIERKDNFRWGPLSISWGGDVEIRVTCPPGSDLDFSSGSCDLQVDGPLGEVTVGTASGDVLLGDVARRLEVKTASGDVFVGAVGDRGSVNTVSGDVQIRSLGGDLNARSVSGDIHIQRILFPVQLSTTSGDVLLDSVEGGAVRAQATSGDIVVGVGPGIRVWIDAASVSGELASELGVGDEPPGDEHVPVVPLQLKTVSGDVQIRRAAEIVSVDPTRAA